MALKAKAKVATVILRGKGCCGLEEKENKQPLKAMNEQVTRSLKMKGKTRMKWVGDVDVGRG